MASSKATKTKKPIGITHHRLEDEQGRQKQVPPRRGQGRDQPVPGTGGRGQRRSRTEGVQVPQTAEGRFEGKGGKGGKTGGSRAGLLASRKATKGGR